VSLTGRIGKIAASAVDRAVTYAVQRGGKARPRANHKSPLETLERLAPRYEPAEHPAYFRAVRRIDPVLRPVREHRGQRVLDCTWASEYSCIAPELSEDYRAYAENRAACARLFVRSAPRPLAILIHGYLGGHYGFEQRVWPLEWLDQHGLDAALFVLPFHGLRATAGERLPAFLRGDPRMTHEGFRQAVADLRDFAQHLREAGHPAVGLMGMSLGGYTAALAATVDATWDFVVPVIPLASLADFALEQGRLSPFPESAQREHAALERVYRLICPVQRAPLVAARRCLILGAEADRITPIAHARRLARHFRAPLVTFAGGHVLQLGRNSAFDRVERLLRDELKLV
jgi:pimeloyl-ACP methyl ester carboxylesterase